MLRAVAKEEGSEREASLLADSETECKEECEEVDVDLEQGRENLEEDTD